MSGHRLQGIRLSAERRLSLTLFSVALALALGVGLFSGPALAQEDDECQFCHGDVEMLEGFDDFEDPARLVVDYDSLTASIHGELGMACVDCHQDLSGVEDYPHETSLAPVECAMCHDDVAEVYAASLHGYALARGNSRAPSCTSCHGDHDIRSSSDPESPSHPDNIPSICEKCHGAEGLPTDRWIKRPHSVETWASSVHGHAAANGEMAPTCATCHGIHDMRGVTDPESPIFVRNVSATCGACHDEIREQYDKSIHGMALAAGISDSPSCTGCHGEHQIVRHDDPDARTSSTHMAHETCGTCHENADIIEKYGLRGGVVGSYEDSYHGWAASSGYEASANCVSCHTAHYVLPQDHPDSTVNAANVVATCGACHPRADVGFAESYAHESASVAANPITLFLRNFYWVLITVVIGGMALHNLVILNYFAVEKRKASDAAGYVRRMDLNQILQHMALAVSFIGLVITGFALRYPDVWWTRYLCAIGMDEGVRSQLHRFFGIAMIITSVWHGAYLVFTKVGRAVLRAMIPGPSDLRAFVQTMKLHTWRGKEHPRHGRFDYTQKAEYWALIWGTVLMALTGLVLWFPAEAVRIFPSWIATVAQTLHYYEAWLATLAILVWHMFFVLFHPDQYPMDWSWLNGRMSRRLAREHHREWYDELAAERRMNVAAPGGAKRESTKTADVNSQT